MSRIALLLRSSAIVFALSQLTGQLYCQQPQPVRDPKAVEAVQLAISKMGGQSLWANVHGAHVEGTIRSASDTETIAWDDDWSLGYLKYRRTFTGNNGIVTRVNDQNGNNTILSASGNLTKLPADKTIIPTYLPAVLLSNVANDPSCAITFAVVPYSEQNSKHVLTACRHAGQFKAPFIAYWHFASTGLPDHVEIPLPDLLHPGRLNNETVEYTQFNGASSNFLPASMVYKNPSGNKRQFTIDVISLR